MKHWQTAPKSWAAWGDNIRRNISPPAELLVTDGGEDGEGEEAGLDVVPVVGELLGHQVHPGRGRLAAHLLVLGEGSGHLLDQAQSPSPSLETLWPLTCLNWVTLSWSSEDTESDMLVMVCSSSARLVTSSAWYVSIFWVSAGSSSSWNTCTMVTESPGSSSIQCVSTLAPIAV